MNVYELGVVRRTIGRAERAQIRRSSIVVAEPLVALGHHSLY